MNCSRKYAKRKQGIMQCVMQKGSNELWGKRMIKVAGKLSRKYAKR